MSAVTYKHNHVARDVKPKGECRACDQYHQHHGGRWLFGFIERYAKRFTDAELAAEYWAALVDCDIDRDYFKCENIERVSGQLSTMARFAESAHYDEEEET